METRAPWADPVLMTAGDLIRLPEDGWRYELVEGRLVRMSPTGRRHGLIVTNLVLFVTLFVREHHLGEVYPAETGFWISAEGQPDTVLAPDLAFISTERESELPADGFMRVAPDLVVEVTSPSQGRAEIGAKARRWLDAGVRIVWLVFPDTRTVEVWRAGTEQTVFTSGDSLSGEDVLPGFHLPVDSLFD